MNYKSLNESILSVTNPQPKNEALTSLQENIDLYNAVLSVVKEGLLGKLKKKVSRFGQGLRDVGGDGPASPSDRLRIARWDRAHRTEGDIQRAHMKHKARATVKEEQEYIELLEFALEAIAEELECDVEDLLEDIQTPERKAEGEKEIKNLSRTRTRRLKSWTKHPNPGSSGYYDAEDRFDKANSAKAARQDQQSAERSSSDTYGKGGKIVKKGKVQKPIEKKGDYVYSHYRDEIITKEQALKDRKSRK